MNFKALITTLVLGSSSVAMADSFTLSGSVKVNIGGSAPTQPTYPTYHPTRPVVVVQPPAPVYRGPFYNPTNTTIGSTASQYKGWVGKSQPRLVRNSYGKMMWSRPAAWFDLTEATRIDSGREFFKIGADKGQFKALKLQGLGGSRSQIVQVAIEFSDNRGTKKTQKVVLNRSLDAAHPITIDLDGRYRSIHRIIVYGSTDRGSAYKILAM